MHLIDCVDALRLRGSTDLIINHVLLLTRSESRNGTEIHHASSGIDSVLRFVRDHYHLLGILMCIVIATLLLLVLDHIDLQSRVTLLLSTLLITPATTELRGVALMMACASSSLSSSVLSTSGKLSLRVGLVQHPGMSLVDDPLFAYSLFHFYVLPCEIGVDLRNITDQVVIADTWRRPVQLCVFEVLDHFRRVAHNDAVKPFLGFDHSQGISVHLVEEIFNLSLPLESFARLKEGFGKEVSTLWLTATCFVRKQL